jgi:hypothetical protein
MNRLISTIGVAALAAALLMGTPTGSRADKGGTHGGPPAVHNPNGVPPIGMPSTNGDTDRGKSEGRGKNDLRAHFVGNISSISGSTVTLRTRTGLLKTFVVTPEEAAEIRNGQHIVMFTSGGAVTRFEPADEALHGTLVSDTKTTVTLRLPNGKLRTITVAPEAAENMALRKGEPVIVSTTTAFTTPALIHAADRR